MFGKFKKINLWKFMLGVLLALCGLVYLAIIVYILVATSPEDEEQVSASLYLLIFGGWEFPIAGGALLLYFALEDLLRPGTWFDRRQRVRVVRLVPDRVNGRELLQFVGLVGKISYIWWPGQRREVYSVKFPGGREATFRAEELETAE